MVLEKIKIILKITNYLVARDKKKMKADSCDFQGACSQTPQKKRYLKCLKKNPKHAVQKPMEETSWVNNYPARTRARLSGCMCVSTAGERTIELRGALKQVK